MAKTFRLSDSEKHSLCLEFAKELMRHKEDAPKMYDANPNEISDNTFYCFLRDYAECRRRIDSDLEQLPF